MLFELESSFKFYEKNIYQPGNVFKIALLRFIILLSLVGDNIDITSSEKSQYTIHKPSQKRGETEKPNE